MTKSADDRGKDIAKVIRSWPRVVIPDGRPIGRICADEIRAAHEAGLLRCRDERWGRVVVRYLYAK